MCLIDLYMLVFT